MKISKIACVALLGASFAVSSAFATAQSDYDDAVKAKATTIKSAKEAQENKAKAYDKVMAQVKILQGIKELKEWDGTATNADAKKQEAFKKISDAVAAINTELANIKPSEGTITLTAADKKSTLTIDNTGAVKVKIDANGDKQEAVEEKTLDFANPTTNAADIAKIFSDKNTKVWDEFVKAFADEHTNQIKKRDEKLDTDLKDNDKTIQTKAVALAKDQTTTPTYEGTVKNYDALDKALKNDIAAKETAKADKEKELAATVKAFKEGANKDKVTLKGTDADSIKKQAEAVTKAKEAATSAESGDEQAKKSAIKKAIEAGVPVKTTGDKKVELSDVDGLKDADLTAALTSAKTNTGEAETALNDVKTKAGEVKAQDTIIETSTKAIADQKAKVKEISNARVKAVVKSQKLDKAESDVLTSLSDIFDNNSVAEKIIVDEAADDVADVARSLNKSFEQSFEALNKGTVANTINFSTSLATSTRLAKLSNPFNENLALASAISKLEGEKFADNGNSLSSVVKEYTNRYNYDNNLWGNISGGKAKLKGSANQDFYGFTLGYDKAFDNTIVGGYFNYTKVEADASQVESKSNNYSLGVYSRSYFGQNELDAALSYGIGKNDLTRKSLNALVGDTTGKYNSKFFGISVDYGYVFGIGNAKFIKPIFGLEYSFIKNDEFKENGGLPANFKATATKVLSAKLAAEFRAYADNGSYFYITPGLQRELAKSVDDGVISFVGSTKELKYLANKEKATFFTLKTGAEFKITNNLSTNVIFGAKAKSKEQYYNGTVGLSYKF